MPAKRNFNRAFGSSQSGAPKKKCRYNTNVATSKPKKFILGATTRATLKYAETIQINQPAVQGSIGTWVFSANGCYDPNISGVGGQPRGFDELLALYDHYTVVSSKIECRFANQANLNRPYVGIAVRDTNVSLPDVKSIAEYGDKVLSANPLRRFDDDGDSSIMLSKAVNVGKFLGRRDVLSDPQLKGSAAANPTEGVFYHIIAGDVSAGGSGDVDVLVTVTYDVILHEPKVPTSS